MQRQRRITMIIANGLLSLAYLLVDLQRVIKRSLIPLLSERENGQFSSFRSFRLFKRKFHFLQHIIIQYFADFAEITSK